MTDTETVKSDLNEALTNVDIGENSDGKPNKQDDEIDLEEDMELDNLESDKEDGEVINLDIESIGTESDDEKEIEFNVDCINAQMNFRSQRRQKLRKQAKATLVEKFGTLADFRTYLKVHNQVTP